MKLYKIFIPLLIFTFLTSACSKDKQFTSGLGEDEILSILGPSHVNVTGVTITGNCYSNGGGPIVITGDIVGAPINAICVNSSYSQSITLVNLNALNTINAVQDLISATKDIVHDTISPVVSIIAPADGTDLSALTEITVTGSCESGLRVTITGTSLVQSNEGACILSQFAIPVTVRLSIGAGLDLVATQTDLAGNSGSDTNTHNIIDLSSMTILSPVNSSSVNLAVVTVTGNCGTGGALVVLSGSGITGGPYQTSCTGAGNFSISNVQLVAGNGSKQIISTQGTATDTVSVILDTIRPVLTITSPMGGTRFNQNQAVTVAGACDSTAMSNVNLSGTGIVSANGPCTANAYSINTNVANTAGDSLTVIATQTDLAGNTGTASILINTFCAGAAMNVCALSGVGSKNSPYVVNSISCLQEMRTGLACYYEIPADINASTANTLNAGAGWAPVGTDLNRFTGQLNGKGNKINNFSDTGLEAGFFGTLGANLNNDFVVYDITFANADIDAVGVNAIGGVVAASNIINSKIEKVRVENSTVDAVLNAGSISPNLSSSSIANDIVTDTDVTTGALSVNTGGAFGLITSSVASNVFYSGAVTSGSSRVGGLVGSMNGGTLSNASSVGSVVGTINVGGLVGFLDNSATVSSAITSSGVNGQDYVGGAIGRSASSSLNYVYSSGNLNTTGDFIGGVVGAVNAGSVISSFSAVSLICNSGSICGGVIGLANGGVTVDRIFFSGTLSGTSTEMGGLVGDLNSGNLTEAFVSVDVPDNLNSGAVVGLMQSGTISSVYYNNSNLPAGGSTGSLIGGTVTANPVTDAQLKQQATFVGWDFTNDWNIDEGLSYPYLR